MRKTASIAGVVAASAGMLAAGSPAFADSADNDGANVGNGNNLNVLPINLCGNNIAILGVVAPIASALGSDCENAPIVDHPSTGGEEKEPETPRTPEDPGTPQDPGTPGTPGTPGAPTDPILGRGEAQPQRQVSFSGELLPTAPAPVSVQGHHAVTG
ncbi:hypothetical protein [Saccharopolyspora cebuensis]|uniref:Small secreted domain n=1 Tax=Saccharopolyspora cebuensis TaxID=418759 RepID=A0ABV4CGD7_9PSEU